MRIIYSCLLVILGFVMFSSAPAHAARPQIKVVYVPCKGTPTDCLDLVEVGKVKTVLKSSQIQMENGAVFILDNIRVPVPYEHDARDFLESLIKGKTVGLYANKTLPPEGQADEHGNEIVHVMLEDGTWVQRKVVEKGLAWADSGEYNRDCVAELYKAEILARAKKNGFWAAPEYKVHDPNHVNNTIGTFILFEGVPKVFRPYAEYDFFGFGYGPDQNQRSFTVAIKHDDEYRFFVLSSDPSRKPFTAGGLAHTRMRVRGWVEALPETSSVKGPMMRVTHPEQMEFPDGNPFQ